jgi:uncharacterized protein YjiS (DUF1127 family)
MLKRLWNRAIEIQEQRANYWKLRNMTDRELNDIGVSRYDIERGIICREQ